MLDDAATEIKKSDDIWGSSNVQALREQQDKDFGLWGPYQFKMPKEQGKWEDVTTNSSTVLGNKILSLLASSWLQLFIDIGEEKRKERKKVSATEQLANGCIWLADRALTSLPSGKSIQSSLATYASLKGGTVKMVYLTELNGKVVSSIPVYDPTFCQWIEGEKDILWFCYRNYVSETFIKHAYKKQIKGGFHYGPLSSTGKILTYTVWDEDEWKVAVNNEWLDGDKHGLGYIPVNIRSCGPVPYIQSQEYQDTMKYSWMSVFAGSRDIAELESKLLSIEMSKALESGKIKLAYDYDSAKSGGKAPEGIEKIGYSNGGRNELVGFDIAKGQKFGGMVEPLSNDTVERLLQRIDGMRILATIDPIAQGVMNRSGSGALAAELRAAALEYINPFRKCIEDDFVWIAEECVRQFKNGDFELMTLEGRDRKRNKFYADITPKDVEEKHFEAQLVPERLRDEIQELGAAIQSAQSGMTSFRTARIKHNIVTDPDMEQDTIDEELASRDPVFKYDKLAKYFKDLGTLEGDRMAEYYMALSAITIEKTVKEAIMQGLIPPQMPGGEVLGEKPLLGVPSSPQAEAGRIAREPQNIAGVGQ